MARLLNAYCEELHDVITIEEAIEYYFAEPDSIKRKKLTFFCSDENCRAKVKGVNYSNVIYKKSPHFSRDDNHHHDEHCIWNLVDGFINAVRNGTIPREDFGESNMFRRYRKDVADHIVDAYIPLANIVAREAIAARQRNIPQRHDIRQWARNYEHRTSLFGKLVRAYVDLSDEERRRTFVRIPTGDGFERILYGNAFVAVPQIMVGQPQRVFYGQARIYKYSSENYKIIFKEYNWNMPHIARTLSVAAIINMRDISDTPFENRLRSSLDTYAKDQKHCNCYILGTAAPGEAELTKGQPCACLVLTPLSLKEIELS